MTDGHLQRTQLLRAAFLARRLPKASVAKLLDSSDVSTERWKDSYEQALSRKSLLEPWSELDEQLSANLEIKDDFEALRDDRAWSAEERAIFRRLKSNSSNNRPVPEQKAYEGSNLSDAGLRAFADLDRNGDLLVDKNELDRLMTGGYYGELSDLANNPEKAALVTVFRAYHETISGSDPFDGDGVSRHDLVSLKENPALKPVKENLDRRFSVMLSRAENLEPLKSIESESFEPLELRQGSAGSCVFLSAITGIESDGLRAMVEPVDEDTFEVAFADGSKETVKDLTIAERLYHSGGQSGERWPALFEKALVQRLFMDKREESGGAVKDLIDGIEPAFAFQVLTGGNLELLSLDELSVDQTRVALKDMADRPGPLICATRPRAKRDFVNIEKLHNGLVNGHAYTVLGFDSDKDEVTLRNPYGHGEWKHQSSPDDGVFEMPLRDFYASFRWIAGSNPA